MSIMLRTIQLPTKRPPLQFGASGQIVKDMQKALNQRLAQLDTISASPLSVSTTGYFDKQTRDAVKYLQCLAFLTVDGIVGAETWAYLSDGAGSLPELYVGSHGKHVKASQQALRDSYYYFGGLDGIFGAKTEEAVRDFQAEHLLKIDGIIGMHTWNELSKLDSHAFRCSITTFNKW
jgi:peptidoglycan hydrolase-like protein with peptidoglycan-binding domain